MIKRGEARLRKIRLFPRLMIALVPLALGMVAVGEMGHWGSQDADLQEVYQLRMRSLSVLHQLQLAQTSVSLGEHALAEARVRADPAARGADWDRIESASTAVEESIERYDLQAKGAVEEQLWREVELRLAEWNRSQKELLGLLRKRLQTPQPRADPFLGSELDRDERRGDRE